MGPSMEGMTHASYDQQKPKEAGGRSRTMSERASGSTERNGASVTRAIEGPITVHKSLDNRADGIVLIYTLHSEAETSVAVSLDDDLAVDDEEDLGFHTEYAPVAWHTEDGRLIMRHVLDPDEETELVLGLRTSDNPIEMHGIQGPPEITEVDQEFDSNVGSDDQAKAQAESSFFGQTDESTVDARESSTTGDRRNNGEPSSATAPNRDADTEVRCEQTGDPETTSTVTGEESVVECLITELENERLEDEKRDRLREHLAPSSSRSTQRQIDHMHGRLEQFAPYVDILQTFLDEVGTPVDAAERMETNLERMREDLDDLTGKVEAIQAAQSEQQMALQSVTKSVQHLDENLTELRAKQEATEDDLAEVNENYEELAASVNRLESAAREELDEMREAVNQFKELADALAGVFDYGTVTNGSEKQT